MITHEHAGRTFLFISLPREKAYNFQVVYEKPYWRIRFDVSESIMEGFPLPFILFGGRLKYPKSLGIIGKASELTEEQCKEMVPEMALGARWKNYSCDHPVWYHTAKQSLYSLLQSHSLQPETTLVLEVKK